MPKRKSKSNNVKDETEDSSENVATARRITSKATAPLSLICEWGICQAPPYDNMLAFIDHITSHLRILAPNVVTLDEASNAEGFQCEWRGCCKNLSEDDIEFVDDGAGSFLHLARHVYYHAFHTKLKCVGQFVLNRQNLPNCLNDSDHRNNIPELGDRLRCQWGDCQKIEDNVEIFYNHVNEHLVSIPVGNNLDVKCKCQWQGCTVEVKSKHKLKEHLRSHTQEKLVACPTCGSLFACNTKFIDHIQRNNNEAECQYQCSHCKKKLSTDRLLRDHMRHHVSQYKCPVCDMTCPNKSTLRTHLVYRHADYRPYSCKQCNYSAKSSHDLRRHEEGHNDDWINCADTTCKFRTKFVWEMNRHYNKKHTGQNDPLYACHLCSERYGRGGQLTQHLRKKHQLKWPSGHMRFKYNQGEDGMYRLQTIRYETSNLKVQSDLVQSSSSAASSSSTIAESSTETQDATQQLLSTCVRVLSSVENCSSTITTSKATTSSEGIFSSLNSPYKAAPLSSTLEMLTVPAQNTVSSYKSVASSSTTTTLEITTYPAENVTAVNNTMEDSMDILFQLAPQQESTSNMSEVISDVVQDSGTNNTGMEVGGEEGVGQVLDLSDLSASGYKLFDSVVCQIQQENATESISVPLTEGYTILNDSADLGDVVDGSSAGSQCLGYVNLESIVIPCISLKEGEVLSGSIIGTIQDPSSWTVTS